MSAFDAYIRLEGSLDGSIVCDEPMSRHTTYRIGGPASLFIECASVADLSLALDILAEEEVPWTIVGKGSNLLVSDEGYKGAIIVLGGEFTQIDMGSAAGEEPLERGTTVCVTAGAAAPLPMLVQSAFKCSLSGLEFAVGTPGTVGGALVMNAGSSKEWMSGVVESVTTYKPGTGLHILHADEIEWGYRSSGLLGGEIVLECVLRLKAADRMMVQADMEARLKRRKANQPLNLPSCGSVFKNPPGEQASLLIAACGLKGTSCGDAQISETHANFIVNNGHATASQVAQLIRTARDKVEEVYGVGLETEVKFLGF